MLTDFFLYLFIYYITISQKKNIFPILSYVLYFNIKDLGVTVAVNNL